MAYSNAYNKPNESAPTYVKLDLKYGVDYARFIHESNNKNLSERRAEWEENIAFAQGYQSMDRVKQYLLDGKDKSYGKLDFTPLNIIPKYLKISDKNLAFDLFVHKCLAIDPTSVEMRKKEEDKLISKMINPVFNERMSQVTNMNFRDSGYIPDSKEDIDVYMETEFMLPQEAAIEQAIDVVKEANNYREIRQKLIQDIQTCGVIVLKDEYDPDYGVHVKRIAPLNYVTSFDSSELNDNRNAYYNGHYEMVSLSDLKNKFGLQMDDAIAFAKATTKQTTITKLANKSDWKELSSCEVEVLFFEFETLIEDKYRVDTNKKNGKLSVSKKSYDYEFNTEGDREVTITETKTRRVWVEGVWVVDSDILLNYGIRTNMVVDSLKRVRSSYSSYDTDEMPFVRKMIPFAEKMNMAYIKMNQMIASARPKGLAINLSALLEIPNPTGGEGAVYSPLQLIEMFNGTGNQLFRQDEFSAGQGLPLTELANGLPSDIGQYVNIWNFGLEQIHNIVGFNPLMAGMGSEKRVSTESNKLAMESSIKSIEYMRDGVLSVEKRLYENIIIRIQDIDRYDKPFKKYVKALGRETFRELMSLEKLHPFTFSLYIEMLPDVEERQNFEKTLELAVSKGEITTADLVDVRDIQNLKVKSMFLKRRIKENAKAAQQYQLQQIAASQQSSIAKNQSDIEKVQIENNLIMERDYKKFLYDRELELLKLQSAQNDFLRKAQHDFDKKQLDQDFQRTQAEYKEQSTNNRQKEKLDAMAKNQLSKDSVKSMKKI